MIYLAWCDADPGGGLEGPWIEVRPVQSGLVLVESEESRSVVYHALKHQLPAGTALLVTDLERVPKAKGLEPGSIAWLRARLPS